MGNQVINNTKNKIVENKGLYVWRQILITGYVRRFYNDDIIPNDIIISISKFYCDIIKSHHLYSIKVIKTGKYLSHQTADGMCRQIYTRPNQSMYEFQFINKYRNVFTIKNKFPDKQLDKLAYHDLNNRIRLDCNGTKTPTKFVLIFDNNKGNMVHYRIKLCDKEYFVGTDNGGAYNYFKNDKKKAFLYGFVNMGDLYHNMVSIYCKTVQKYFSFHIKSRKCRIHYGLSDDSIFLFEEIKENVFVIMNKHTDGGLNDKYITYSHIHNSVGLFQNGKPCLVELVRLKKPDNDDYLKMDIDGYKQNEIEFYMKIYNNDDVNLNDCLGWIGCDNTQNHWVLLTDKDKAKVFVLHDVLKNPHP